MRIFLEHRRAHRLLPERIGDHDVEPSERAVVEKRRVAERVAASKSNVVAAQREPHPREGEREWVELLTEEAQSALVVIDGCGLAVERPKKRARTALGS